MMCVCVYVRERECVSVGVIVSQCVWSLCNKFKGSVLSFHQGFQGSNSGHQVCTDPHFYFFFNL